MTSLFIGKVEMRNQPKRKSLTVLVSFSGQLGTAEGVSSEGALWSVEPVPCLGRLSGQCEDVGGPSLSRTRAVREASGECAWA